MNLVWHDSRLKHLWVETPGEPLPIYEPDVHHAFPGRANPRRRSYLDALHHRDRVWVPDVYFVKHGDFRSNLDPGNLALRIYPNGTVSYTQRYVISHFHQSEYNANLQTSLSSYVELTLKSLSMN